MFIELWRFEQKQSILGDVLKTYKCDFLCLQELWFLDETLYRLGSISTDYMYTVISVISGVDSGNQCR